MVQVLNQNLIPNMRAEKPIFSIIPAEWRDVPGLENLRSYLDQAIRFLFDGHVVNGVSFTWMPSSPASKQITLCVSGNLKNVRCSRETNVSICVS